MSEPWADQDVKRIYLEGTAPADPRGETWDPNKTQVVKEGEDNDMLSSKNLGDALGAMLVMWFKNCTLQCLNVLCHAIYKVEQHAGLEFTHETEMVFQSTRHLLERMKDRNLPELYKELCTDESFRKMMEGGRDGET